MMNESITKKSLKMFINNEIWTDSSEQLRIEDIFVFVGLESLGTLAITGNLCLIIVLLRNKYLNRASFILMLSLAIADVLHGIVTTSFFYPPILLKTIPISSMGIRIFNIIDWTAWSITLTHMSAICLDRLIAIMLYGRYNLIVTVQRIRYFTITCWILFFLLNCTYILLKFCCLITPLRNNQFYTFGYGDFETEVEKQLSPFNATNVFTLTYTPLELVTIAILSISNPITLVQLYRRHKRKIALRIQVPSPQPSSELHSNGNEPCVISCSPALQARSQWQRASTMLLEMSMRMGSKTFTTDVRELASRRANRQQQRILLQISVVAVIFYLYMTTYYLVYHILEVENKWVVLFNSFFYSTTHMINPIIYFSLNKEMRSQLTQAFNDLFSWIICSSAKPHHNYDGYGSLRKTSFEQKGSTNCKNEFSITATETSPLVSQQNHSLPHSYINDYASCTVIQNQTVHQVLLNKKQDELNTIAIKNFPSFRMRPNEVLEKPRDSIDDCYENIVISNIINKDSSSSSMLVVEMDDPTELDKYREPSAEHLELDLISSYSVETFKRRTSTNSNNNGSCIIGVNKTSECDSIIGCQQPVVRSNTDDAVFMNLARCLEDHAKIFFDNEKVAMNRSTKQRNALLDALIDALKCYKYNDLEDFDLDEILTTQNELQQRKSLPEINCKRNGQRSASFMSSNRLFGVNLKAVDIVKLRRAISERSRTYSTANNISTKENNPIGIITGSHENVLTNCVNKTQSIDVVNGGLPQNKNICSITSSSSTSIPTTIIHHVPQSSSWRQWREFKLKNVYPQQREPETVPNFGKITKREMLRDSLLMLLDSPSINPNDEIKEETVEQNNLENITTNNISKTPDSYHTNNDGQEYCIYFSVYSSGEDIHDFEDEEDVIFL